MKGGYDVERYQQHTVGAYRADRNVSYRRYSRLGQGVQALGRSCPFRFCVRGIYGPPYEKGT